MRVPSKDFSLLPPPVRHLCTARGAVGAEELPLPLNDGALVGGPVAHPDHGQAEGRHDDKSLRKHVVPGELLRVLAQLRERRKVFGQRQGLKK